MSIDTKGDYNAAEYNEIMYNDNDVFLSLIESITSTDGTVPKDDSIVKTELITLIDNLQKYFNGAIFNDLITSSDVRLMMPVKAVADSLSLSDAKVIAFLKNLPETVTLTDLRTIVLQRSLVDFIILIDILTKQITDKRLPMETLRMSDWLSIRNSPQSDPWS